MPKKIKLICYDWNGTARKSPNDADFWDFIRVSLARERASEFSLAGAIEAYRLYFTVSSKLKKKRVECNNGLSCYGEISDIYNEDVLNGMPLPQFLEYMNKFADKFPKDELDNELLEDIECVGNIPKIVLSTSFHGVIEAVLSKQPYRLPDKIIANDITITNDEHFFSFKDVDSINYNIEDFTIDRFHYGGIFSEEAKAIELKRYCQQNGINLDEVAYIGDHPIVDLNCFKMVGVPIVSRYAPEDAKNAIVKETNAYVIGKNGKELMDYVTAQF